MTDSIRLLKGYWLVVCDARKSLILENNGSAAVPDLVVREVRETKVPSARSLGTDRPGRVHQSMGAARSSVEQADRHDAAELQFLRDLAERLDKAVMAGEVKGIVLIAPPHALGVLRAAMSTHVAAALKGEIAKDFVDLTVGEIASRLKP